MEKLIKLLDEYSHKKTEDLERGKQRVDNQKLWIISKQFGFIRWLVENDKIDRERINDRWGDMSIHFTDEQLFIMSLSISDTPIDDLVLYLK